jgi:hypothetical protein
MCKNIHVKVWERVLPFAHKSRIFATNVTDNTNDDL